MKLEFWNKFSGKFTKDITDYIQNRMDEEEANGMIINKEIVEDILKEILNHFNEETNTEGNNTF